MSTRSGDKEALPDKDRTRDSLVDDDLRVELFGYHESTGPCGYCKYTDKSPIEQQSEPSTTASPNSSSSKRKSYGAKLYAVPPAVYDQMIQRNWRRAGGYFYRPANKCICCPQYAIRLLASDARFNKHHRQVIRRFDRYLSFDGAPKEDEYEVEQINTDVKHEINAEQIEKAIYEAFQARYPSLGQKIGLARDKVRVSRSKKDKKQLACNISCIIQGLCKRTGIEMPRPLGEMSREIIDELRQSGRLSSILGNGADGAIIMTPSNGFINIAPKSDSVKDAQISNKNIKARARIHRNDMMKRQQRLVLVVSPSTFKQDEYELYMRYQINIHKDPPDKVTESDYTRFLVSSTLTFDSLVSSKDGRQDLRQQAGQEIEVLFEKDGSAGPGTVKLGFITDQIKRCFDIGGSYHIRYELRTYDDIASVQKSTLLAISVVDVLPSGLSSVYFIYDIDYKHLSLGVLSALVEIELVKWYGQLANSFKYYYLGFYIHRCTKMRYKSQYEPSEILCPVTLNWTPLDDRVKRILDRNKYAKLSISDGSQYDHEGQSDEKVVDGMFISHRNVPVSLMQQLQFILGHPRPGSSNRDHIISGSTLLKRYNINPEILEILVEWVKLTGISLAETILISI